MKLRRATFEDVPRMVAIAAEGATESNFGGTFDVPRAIEYLETFLAWDDAIIMLAVDDEILGGVILVKSYEVWSQPICYIVKFWLSKAGRRTRASRRLIRFVDSWARRQDCIAIYATATGELSDREQKLFENMMKRSGYSNVGPTLKNRITPDE